MSEEIPFIPYEEVLKRLENTNDENNLLLGNGFNTSLGVGTSYEDIFEKMKEEYIGYKKLEEKFKEKKQDIEELIGVLTESISDNKEFLSSYINNKVKLDFMKAANIIIQSKIKNIYNNKNEGIYILFSKFMNYFTLNYDPFLYLLLMKFKLPLIETIKENNSQMNTLGFIETINSQYASLTENQQKLCEIIKKARDEGKITVSVNERTADVSLKNTTKTKFLSAMKDFLKNNDFPYKNKDIDKVINHILVEEQNEKEQKQLRIIDGFISNKEKECVYRSLESQNVFFLHGAFHIKIAKDKTYKITQTSEKALYTKIEEAINKEEKIICVFKDNNKLDEINKNDYLKTGYNYLKTGYEKLSTLRGSLVIIGCSLSENDEHIFKQIEASAIDTIYISSMADKEKQDLIRQDYEKAKKYFTKEVVLFAPMSI